MMTSSMMRKYLYTLDKRILGPIQTIGSIKCAISSVPKLIITTVDAPVPVGARVGLFQHECSICLSRSCALAQEDCAVRSILRTTSSPRCRNKPWVGNLSHREWKIVRMLGNTLASAPAPKPTDVRPHSLWGRKTRNQYSEAVSSHTLPMYDSKILLISCALRFGYRFCPPS